jgi:hypothetical protein
MQDFVYASPAVTCFELPRPKKGARIAVMSPAVREAAVSAVGLAGRVVGTLIREEPVSANQGCDDVLDRYQS